ncbi:MAG TPA: PhnD/SsuA/transferrin family substrate-binding protein [Acidimicrobiia bacterium]|nr:PhnD/SsuA/transferrin family substrate-binding protein [Acidimicrobiia bacterium]
MADLRFGTFLAPNMLPVYQAIADAVGEALGMSTELIVETDYENCQKDVNDICFVCSLPYVMFERQGISPAEPIAAPVLQGERYGGKPVYYSDVIVHRDSDAQSFLDLRGRSWSVNEPLSQSGYGITRYHLVSIGETGGFFSEVINAGFHEESIRMVADGRVDASAIDSQVLAIEMRDRPDLASHLKVIESLGPSTIQPVAVSRRFDPAFRDAVTDILVGFHTTERGREVLDLGLVEKWVPIGVSDYDDIRAMVDACEQAGFMKLR